MEFITTVELSSCDIEDAVKHYIAVEYGKEADEILEMSIEGTGPATVIKLKFIERY